MPYPIDTLKIFTDLKDADFSENQAQAIVNALVESSRAFALVEQLESFKTSLETDLNNLKLRFYLYGGVIGAVIAIYRVWSLLES